MIDHKRKCIFIHVPRTGGSSIEQAFGYPKHFKDKHLSLDIVRNQISFNQFNDYFKFTFVRNPWDIMISKYVDLWYNTADWGGAIGLSSNKSLKFFLSHYKPAEHELQGDTFFDYFNPNEMDFIGRFETRKQDLEYISCKLNHHISHKVKIKHHPNKLHYTKYYDDETKEIVRKMFKRDIEYFGYKFDE